MLRFPTIECVALGDTRGTEQSIFSRALSRTRGLSSLLEVPKITNQIAGTQTALLPERKQRFMTVAAAPAVLGIKPGRAGISPMWPEFGCLLGK